MENDHLIDWSKVKILKVEHDTRSVFSLKVGTSTKSPKYSIEMMGYHSLLFTESCLISSVEFLLVQSFRELVLTCFAAMLIRRNYFHRTAFIFIRTFTLSV